MPVGRYYFIKNGFIAITVRKSGAIDIPSFLQAKLISFLKR